MVFRSVYPCVTSCEAKLAGSQIFFIAHFIDIQINNSVP